MALAPTCPKPISAMWLLAFTEPFGELKDFGFAKRILRPGIKGGCKLKPNLLVDVLWEGVRMSSEPHL